MQRIRYQFSCLLLASIRLFGFCCRCSQRSRWRLFAVQCTFRRTYVCLFYCSFGTEPHARAKIARTKPPLNGTKANRPNADTKYNNKTIIVSGSQSNYITVNCFLWWTGHIDCLARATRPMHSATVTAIRIL